jgi:RNA polymerase sigma-70 factor (ECF subfamily)
MSLDEDLLELAPDRRPEEIPFTPEQIAGALSQLPMEQREAVVLKIYEGFTFAQIAHVTQVSPNTAASRYRYGVDKLAEKLTRGAGRT